MQSNIRPVYLVFLTQSVLCLAGCEFSFFGSQAPGTVPSPLPGATIISQNEFNSLLQSGQLAPYKKNSNSSGGIGGNGIQNGKTEFENSKELDSAGNFGNALLVVNDYGSAHPKNIHFRTVFTHPQSIIEMVDSRGRRKKIQLMDNSYRILSLAKSIQNSDKARENNLSIQDETAKNDSTTHFKSLIDGKIPARGLASVRRKLPKNTKITIRIRDKKAPAVTKRGIASIQDERELSETNAGLPNVSCSTAELGHGRAWDAGELDGNQDSTFEVYSDGLISNFEWPLKSFASCIKDQGIRGTCTAFSVIGAMETLISKKQNQSTNFSEQALYFKGKGFLDPNSPDSDGFAANYFLDNFQNNSGFLVPYENQWDYNLSPGRDSESDFSNSCGSSYSEFCSNSASQGKLVCTKPSSGSSQCGYLSQVKSPSAGARISNSISFLDTGNVSQSLKKAVDYLNKGIPVIVETTLTERFYIPDHGFVAEPSSSDHTSGGHSTLAVGYISEQQIQNFLPSRHVSGNGGYFIIKNSWGPFIGDAGYFYVSFKYLLKYVYSLFAIQDVEFHK